MIIQNKHNYMNKYISSYTFSVAPKETVYRSSADFGAVKIL